MDFPVDLASVDPNNAADMHPLDFLQKLVSQQPQASASMSPSVVPPSLPAKAAPQGDGWRGLLHMLAPVVGAMAMGHGVKQTGFMNGYSEGARAVDEERKQKAAEAEHKSRIASDYMLRISDQAQGITDPVQFQKFADLADAAFVKAGFGQPGEIKNQLAFPANALAKKQLKELNDQLDGIVKQGYNPDELAQSGATLTLENGTHVPIATAMQLTRVRPQDASGKPIAKPMKAAATEEERYVQKWATEKGLKPDALTAEQELNARKEFRDAGRPDPNVKSYPPGGVDSQYNDLVELWKVGHPGQEPPPEVRTKLRKDANSVNDKAATGMGGAAGNSTLDPDGIDYAATEYRVTGKMPPLGMGNGQARAAIINTAAKQAKTLGQSAAAAIQRQAAYKADGASLTKITGMASAAEAFETKALAQADIVDSLSQKVGRTQYPIINDGLLTAKARIAGDTDTQLLYNALTTFTNEYAKIMEGSTGSAAGSTDSARAAASRLISAGLSKGTLSQTLDLMRREMRLTIAGYDATKAHITERMGGKAPAAPTTPDKATGKTYQLVNGKWVLQ